MREDEGIMKEGGEVRGRTKTEGGRRKKTEVGRRKKTEGGRRQKEEEMI